MIVTTPLANATSPPIPARNLKITLVVTFETPVSLRIPNQLRM